MPSDEQLDTIIEAVHNGTLDPRTLPEDKRRNIKIALIDYQSRKSGNPITPSLPAEAQVPGMFPYDEEKKIWDQANKDGLDYYQAKDMVKNARNEYTQYRPEGGIGENIKGASAVVAGTAMAPIGLAKRGVKAVGQGLQDAYPDSTAASVVGGGIKLASELPPSSPLQVAGNVAADTGVPVALNAGKEPAKKIVGWFAQKFGGIADDTIKLLEDRAPEVVNYARKGYQAATKAATNAGKEIQTHIEEYANKAGEEYRKAIEAIIQKNPEYNNLRIDLHRLIGDQVDSIRNDFGFTDTSSRLPNLDLVDSAGNAVKAAQGKITRIGKADADTALFNDFANQIKDGLTPSQAYYLQKDMSDSIKINKGKPIAAALSQMKKKVVSGFDSVVDKTPIGSPNKNYRIAMEVGEDLAKVENADNPLQVVRSAFARDTNTADALNDFFGKSPAAKAAWDTAQVADAGAKISAWSRNLPNNGLALAPAAAISSIAHTAGASIPAALGVAGAEFAATSPRLYGEGFNLLSKEVPKTAARVGGGASLAALRALRQQKGK